MDIPALGSNTVTISALPFENKNEPSFLWERQNLAGQWLTTFNAATVPGEQRTASFVLTLTNPGIIARTSVIPLRCYAKDGPGASLTDFDVLATGTLTVNRLAYAGE